MYTTSKLEMYEDLQRAAGFDANKIYPALFQHLGYRKCVAEQILLGGDFNRMVELELLYENINKEIKLIIGI